MNEIKIIETRNSDAGVINMPRMEPLQIAKVVIDPTGNDVGHIVMRTASVSMIEIMDLTDPGRDNCWETADEIKVKLLPKARIEVILCDGDDE